MRCQKKVGIMGGTFDPIHVGHLILAQQACCQYELDEVWFMPSSQPPHKDNGGISAAKDREAMVKLSIAGNDKFIYSDLELHRRGTTYTSDTLMELDETYPDIEFYFIMGADSLFHIETWHEPQVIFDHAVVLSANRDFARAEEIEAQAEHLKEKYGADIRLISMDCIGISSTEIRELKKKGLSIRYYVPDGVFEYIMENDLYS